MSSGAASPSTQTLGPAAAKALAGAGLHTTHSNVSTGTTGGANASIGRAGAYDAMTGVVTARCPRPGATATLDTSTGTLATTTRALTEVTVAVGAAGSVLLAGVTSDSRMDHPGLHAHSSPHHASLPPLPLSHVPLPPLPPSVHGAAVVATARTHAAGLPSRADALAVMEAAMEYAPSGQLVADGSGAIVTANAAVCSMFRYSRADMLALNVDDLLPAQQRMAHAAQRAGFMHASESRTMGTGRDVMAARSDGTPLPVEIGLSTLHTRDGPLVLCTLIDISPRRAMEVLREDKLRTEAAARARTEFVAHTSHELRTPINGIVGMTELLAETALTEEQRGYVANIAACADSLTHLVGDILDFSKLEAGRMEVERIAVDPRSLVTRVLATVAGERRRPGVTLDVSVAPTLPARCTGDPTRIVQVLTNLLSNALKFTEAGSVKLTMWGEALPTTARITVPDVGGGGGGGSGGGGTGGGSAETRPPPPPLGSPSAAAHGSGLPLVPPVPLPRSSSGGTAYSLAPDYLLHVTVADTGIGMSDPPARACVARWGGGGGRRRGGGGAGGGGWAFRRGGGRGGGGTVVCPGGWGGGPPSPVPSPRPVLPTRGAGGAAAATGPASVSPGALAASHTTAVRHATPPSATLGSSTLAMMRVRPVTSGRTSDGSTVLVESCGATDAHLTAAEPERPCEFVDGGGGGGTSHARRGSAPRESIVDGFVGAPAILLAEDNSVNQQLLLRHLSLEARLAAGERLPSVVDAAARPRRIPIIAMTGNVLPTDRDRAIAAGMDVYLTKPLRRDTLHGVLRTTLPPAFIGAPPPPPS